MNKDSNIIDKAIELAVKWHTGQIRKADGLPYIIHPIMVAHILTENGFDDETNAAGFCHDLLEDTKCSASEIKKACGEKVLKIVKTLTNQELSDWRKKKSNYIQSVRKGPVEAKAVCVADKIHNLQSLITAHAKKGPIIWKKFNRGKEDKIWFESEVLKMLKETWKHPLIKEYESLIEKEKKLEV